MNVQMRHLLMGIKASICEQAITRLDQTIFAGDMANGANETSNFRLAGTVNMPSTLKSHWLWKTSIAMLLPCWLRVVQA
jgi:hypothetical protein